MISISCLESKLLNNNNWYGRFQLAPFRKGEGLTVANALRRTLLAEKSNFYITWVDLYNAEIPYSVLTGMRESIFDILLNLKQVVFTSDVIGGPDPFLGRDSTSSTSIKTDYSDNNLSTPPIPHHWSNTNIPLHTNQSNYLIQNFSQRHSTSKSYGQKCNPITTVKILSENLLWHNLAITNALSSPTTQNNRRIGSHQVPMSGFKRGSYSRKKDRSGGSKSVNSTYIGSICVKGPAQIYAKNIRLPKGLKCVDPDKYIVTLADDGLFYLRFEVTGEMRCVPIRHWTWWGQYGPWDLPHSRDKVPFGVSNSPSIIGTNSETVYSADLSVNRGLGFNNLVLTEFPGDKEIRSRIAFSREKDANVLVPQVAGPPFKWGRNPWRETTNRLPYPKKKTLRYPGSTLPASKDPRFLIKWNSPASCTRPPNPISRTLQSAPGRVFEGEKRILWRGGGLAPSASVNNGRRLNAGRAKPWVPTHRGASVSASTPKKWFANGQSPRPIDHSVKVGTNISDPNTGSRNLTRKLIRQQRLLLTNDSIKQCNFQNTSIIANIQKTSLLNVQVKHYYYKCGRFDRFLFDLIRSVKPSIFEKNARAPISLMWGSATECGFTTFANGVGSGRNLWKRGSKPGLGVDVASTRKVPNIKYDWFDTSGFKQYYIRLIESLFPAKKIHSEINSNRQGSGVTNRFRSIRNINRFWSQLELLRNLSETTNNTLFNQTRKKMYPTQVYSIWFPIPTTRRKAIPYGSDPLAREVAGLGAYPFPGSARFLGRKAAEKVSRNIEYGRGRSYNSTDRVVLSGSRVFRVDPKNSFCLPKFPSQKHPFPKSLMTWKLTGYGGRNRLIICGQPNVDQPSVSFLKKCRVSPNLIAWPYKMGFKIQDKMDYQPLLCDTIRHSIKQEWVVLGLPLPWDPNRPMNGSIQCKNIPARETKFISDQIYPFGTSENWWAGYKQKTGRDPRSMVRPNTQWTIASRIRPIPDNSVVLKPIYLNVEHIIYVLKQSTRFHKNQRVDQSFFDFVGISPLPSVGIKKQAEALNQNSLERIPLGTNYNLGPFERSEQSAELLHSPFPMGSHFPIRSLMEMWSIVRYRDGSKARKTNSNIKTVISDQQWYETQSVIKKNTIIPSFWFYRAPNFNQSSGLEAKTEDPRAGIRGNEDLLPFANVISYNRARRRGNQDNIQPSPIHHRLLAFWARYKPTRTWGGVHSCFHGSTRYLNNLFKMGRSELGNSCLVWTSKTKLNANKGWPLFLTYGIPIFKKGYSVIGQCSSKPMCPITLYFKIDQNNTQAEPYSLNVYNSKISYTLRYTYPFKYTIFETILQFLFKSGGKGPGSAEKIRFDSIQSNESYKIYTNLACPRIKQHQSEFPSRSSSPEGARYLRNQNAPSRPISFNAQARGQFLRLPSGKEPLEGNDTGDETGYIQKQNIDSSDVFAEPDSFKVGGYQTHSGRDFLLSSTPPNQNVLSTQKPHSPKIIETKTSKVDQPGPRAHGLGLFYTGAYPAFITPSHFFFPEQNRERLRPSFLPISLDTYTSERLRGENITDKNGLPLQSNRSVLRFQNSSHLAYTQSTIPYTFTPERTDYFSRVSLSPGGSWKLPIYSGQNTHVPSRLSARDLNQKENRTIGPSFISGIDAKADPKTWINGFAILNADGYRLPLHVLLGSSITWSTGNQIYSLSDLNLRFKSETRRCFNLETPSADIWNKPWNAEGTSMNRIGTFNREIPKWAISPPHDSVSLGLDSTRQEFLYQNVQSGNRLANWYPEQSNSFSKIQTKRIREWYRIPARWSDTVLKWRILNSISYNDAFIMVPFTISLENENPYPFSREMRPRVPNPPTLRILSPYAKPPHQGRHWNASHYTSQAVKRPLKWKIIRPGYSLSRENVPFSRETRMLPPFFKKGGKYSAFLVQQVERETRMKNYASIISHSAGAVGIFRGKQGFFPILKYMGPRILTPYFALSDRNSQSALPIENSHTFFEDLSKKYSLSEEAKYGVNYQYRDQFVGSSGSTSSELLAIDFENVYYKNFLWNSRKITLRILTDAILPLVADRKFQITHRRHLLENTIRKSETPRNTNIVTSNHSIAGLDYKSNLQRCVMLMQKINIILLSLKIEDRSRTVGRTQLETLNPTNKPFQNNFMRPGSNSEPTGDKSPSIINLWTVPFFCMYSLYAISTESDQFLQNLISTSDLVGYRDPNSGRENYARDQSRIASSKTPPIPSQSHQQIPSYLFDSTQKGTQIYQSEDTEQSSNQSKTPRTNRAVMFSLIPSFQAKPGFYNSYPTESFPVYGRAPYTSKSLGEYGKRGKNGFVPLAPSSHHPVQQMGICLQVAQLPLRPFSREKKKTNMLRYYKGQDTLGKAKYWVPGLAPKNRAFFYPYSDKSNKFNRVGQERGLTRTVNNTSFNALRHKAFDSQVVQNQNTNISLEFLPSGFTRKPLGRNSSWGPLYKDIIQSKRRSDFHHADQSFLQLCCSRTLNRKEFCPTPDPCPQVGQEWWSPTLFTLWFSTIYLGKLSLFSKQNQSSVSRYRVNRLNPEKLPFLHLFTWSDAFFLLKSNRLNNQKTGRVYSCKMIIQIASVFQPSCSTLTRLLITEPARLTQVALSRMLPATSLYKSSYKATVESTRLNNLREYYRNKASIIFNPTRTHNNPQIVSPIEFLDISSINLDIKNKGSYGMVGYFTIKTNLNSIHKVNYIVESHPVSSSPPHQRISSSLPFTPQESNRVLAPYFGPVCHTHPPFSDKSETKRGQLPSPQGPITMSERGQNTGPITLAGSVFSFSSQHKPPGNHLFTRFLDETGEWHNHSAVLSRKSNGLDPEDDSESIQIDIWTDGSLSPRQALLNAFKKLFELFYNLSKSNYLKPIEI